MRSFETTDHFYMPTTAHDKAWERLATKLPKTGATLEVGLHPGYEEEWRDRERRSLAPFVEEIRRQGHELVGWNAIAGRTSELSAGVPMEHLSTLRVRCERLCWSRKNLRTATSGYRGSRLRPAAAQADSMVKACRSLKLRKTVRRNRYGKR